jgi:hypothetical protein
MARQKAERTRIPQQRQKPEAQPSTISGKLVILTVVGLALIGGGFSWWFRYTATHRAAIFWGPEAVRLIREAPAVYWIVLGPIEDEAAHVHVADNPFADHYHTLGGAWRVAERREITNARGLIHLRNELLMDRSFRAEDGLPPATGNWQSALEFRGSPANPPLVIFFTDDCRQMMRHPPVRGATLAVPSDVLADGLKTVFQEWRSLPTMAAEPPAAAQQSER